MKQKLIETLVVGMLMGGNLTEVEGRYIDIPQVPEDVTDRLAWATNKANEIADKFFSENCELCGGECEQDSEPTFAGTLGVNLEEIEEKSNNFLKEMLKNFMDAETASGKRSDEVLKLEKLFTHREASLVILELFENIVEKEGMNLAMSNPEIMLQALLKGN